MKNLLSVFCFLVIAQLSFSQEKLTVKDLYGTWKIKSFEGEGGLVYCDLEKDSLFVSEKLKKDWKPGQDSLIAASALNFMIEAMKEMQMVFEENSVFKEVRKIKIQRRKFFPE